MWGKWCPTCGQPKRKCWCPKGDGCPICGDPYPCLKH